MLSTDGVFDAAVDIEATLAALLPDAGREHTLRSVAGPYGVLAAAANTLVLIR